MVLDLRISGTELGIRGIVKLLHAPGRRIGLPGGFGTTLCYPPIYGISARSVEAVVMTLLHGSCEANHL
jgi:hypothetical protein